MKINILSPGRFHVCDLARELDKNRFDVKFYSFVPTKRAMRFGLPKHCSQSVIYFIAPFLFFEKILFRKVRFFNQLRIFVQDIFTSYYMRKCDILICMSGDFIHSPIKAKKNGSFVILERGSKHILEQKRILESIPSLKGKYPVPLANVKRELKGYEIADYIAIATQHVKDSFLNHHYPESKLFINPYGVDLSMFKPSLNTQKKYDIIMVGNWCYRKGCDLIAKAIQETDYLFLHVGAIGDLDFPQDTRFTHIDSIDQALLISYYHQAKIFLLPSREEGLAMVQAQAIACNLPLIGSTDSGAVDLKQMVEHPEYIHIIKNYTPHDVQMAIEKALRSYESLTKNNVIYAGKAIQELTWEAYGKRYAEFIKVICQKS